jgi:hypothetical protein
MRRRRLGGAGKWNKAYINYGRLGTLLSTNMSSLKDIFSIICVVFPASARERCHLFGL